MREFGPEAYFVNIPSSFMDASLKPTSQAQPSESELALNAFLSYSANFAFKGNSTPVGSGYHWSLQQFRFSLGDKYICFCQDLCYGFSPSYLRNSDHVLITL